MASPREVPRPDAHLDADPPRLETRELSYFVALAEELHFGRAADRLGMAQPPLSRAIARLERRLSVTLFNRDRSVTLTPAGEVLLTESRHILDAVSAAAHRTHRAGQPRPTLVLATKSGGDAGLLPALLTRYAEIPDTPHVEVLLCGIGEQESLLRTGQADCAFLHLPYDDPTGLDTEYLRTEPQVAVLPATHPLAQRHELRLADLAAEPHPRWPGTNTPGIPVRDSAQLLQLIELGRAVAVLPASIRLRATRPTLAFVPVPDAEPTTLVLAWPPTAKSHPLADLISTAADVAAEARARDASPVAD
jgi:LysR family transcriptional regulator, benzoate and cis,cis-muconate-responsive activator of ben and cat genes